MTRQLSVCKSACVNRLRDTYNIPEFLGSLMFDEFVKRGQATLDMLLASKSDTVNRQVQRAKRR